MQNLKRSILILVRLSSFLLLIGMLWSCNSINKAPMIKAEDKDAVPLKATKIEKIDYSKLTVEDFEAVIPGTYVIHEGDVLELMIEGQPDTQILENTLTPKGYLHYLMAEPVLARGLTVDQLRLKLSENLKSYYNDPQVYISVRKQVKNNYCILGKVTAPGVYDLSIPVRLRDAIAIAGGLAKGVFRGEEITIASLENSYVIRDGKKLPIDFTKLVENADFSKNIYIRPGDYIYIASNASKEIYVLGNIAQPRAFYYKDNLALMEVLSTIRYNIEGDTRRVVVLRGRLSNNPQVIDVDVGDILAARSKDIYLKPDDIVFVPDKPYSFTKELLKAAARAFVGAFSSDAARYIATEEIF